MQDRKNVKHCSTYKHLTRGDIHPPTLGLLNTLIDLSEAWNKLEKAEEQQAKLSQIEDSKE